MGGVERTDGPDADEAPVAPEPSPPEVGGFPALAPEPPAPAEPLTPVRRTEP